MKLLNYKNTHFDLIVHKDYPLLSQVPMEEPGERKIVTQNTTKKTKHIPFHPTPQMNQQTKHLMGKL